MSQEPINLKVTLEAVEPTGAIVKSESISMVLPEKDSSESHFIRYYLYIGNAVHRLNYDGEILETI
jgi:hypothetical protein